MAVIPVFENQTANGNTTAFAIKRGHRNTYGEVLLNVEGVFDGATATMEGSTDIGFTAPFSLGADATFTSGRGITLNLPANGSTSAPGLDDETPDIWIRFAVSGVGGSTDITSNIFT